jgi:cytochrome c oxidase subunit III
MTTVRSMIDVSHLDTHAFGPRDPLWWGLMGMILIEATGFALIMVIYFYVRGNFVHWPPTPMPHGPLIAATASTVALLASGVAANRLCASAIANNLRGVRYWVGLLFVLCAVILICRSGEFAALPFTWDRT